MLVLGVVEGDLAAIEAYKSSGGDIARQLTADEVRLLNRPSAFDVGSFKNKTLRDHSVLRNMIDFWNSHHQKWADCEHAMRTERLFTSLIQGHLVAQVH